MALKVLQIINSLSTGGAEKLIVETLPLYRELGVEMDVLLFDGTPFPFYKKLEETKCCTIFSLGLKSVYNPIAIFKLIPYLIKYDIVHVHLFPSQYYVVLAKWLSFSKTKLIFTEHNTSNRRLENPLFKWIDQFIYRGYNKIVCITEEIQKIILVHTQFPSSRTEVILNGIVLQEYYQAVPYEKEVLKFKETDKIVIQVSGFREQKDQPTLIKSLLHLPQEVKLVLVGVGVLKNSCEDLVSQLRLQDRVFFLGVRTDVPRLLKTADIVVLSSKYEGLSLSSIEGMASGKPFLASNVPGLTEIVSGAGVLFTLGDEKELAQKIMNLLNDDKLYQSVVATCETRANEYDIKKMIAQHITLYKSLN
jgi:glycosyltransferase involved in cell wall biosynthesis